MSKKKKTVLTVSKAFLHMESFVFFLVHSPFIKAGGNPTTTTTTPPQTVPPEVENDAKLALDGNCFYLLSV